MQNLGDEGCCYVVEALVFNTVCQSLDLSNNGIGTKGVEHLSEMLKSNDVLKVLTLSTNNAGDEGASALAKLLASIKSVSKRSDLIVLSRQCVH